MEDVIIDEERNCEATAAAQASLTPAYPQVWLTRRCVPCASCWMTSRNFFVWAPLARRVCRTPVRRVKPLSSVMSGRITIVHVSASIFSLMFHLLCQHKQHRQALSTKELLSRFLVKQNQIQQTSARLAADSESDDDAFMQLRGQWRQHVSTASAAKKRQNKIQQTSGLLAEDCESDDDAFMQLCSDSTSTARLLPRRSSRTTSLLLLARHMN